MSDYKYTDSDGDELKIRSTMLSRKVIITTRGGLAAKSVYIPNADVPAVAAELLKAAGQEGVFVAKSADIVRERSDGFVIGFGQLETSVPSDVNPELVRAWAANYVAIAEYIENKGKHDAEAAIKLQERRDALAKDLSEGRRTYGETGLTAQAAIDRIIELEDATNA